MQMDAAVIDKKLYDHLLNEHHELKLAYAGLQHQLSQLQKMIFASRQERFTTSDVNPSQLSMDLEADAVAACSVVDAKKISYTRSKVAISENPPVHHGRMKLPEHLSREEIIIEPSQDITSCRKMGEEITEVLEWEPGELFVKRYVRPK